MSRSRRYQSQPLNPQPLNRDDFVRFNNGNVPLRSTTRQAAHFLATRDAAEPVPSTTEVGCGFRFRSGTFYADNADNADNPRTVGCFRRLAFTVV